MKINGLKKTVSELRKCPRGWGLMVGYNAKTNKLFTSDLCRHGDAWSKLEDYEFTIGYFSGDYPINMKDLEFEVRCRLDYYHGLGLRDEREAWANKALTRLS